MCAAGGAHCSALRIPWGQGPDCNHLPWPPDGPYSDTFSTLRPITFLKQVCHASILFLKPSTTTLVIGRAPKPTHGLAHTTALAVCHSRPHTIPSSHTSLRAVSRKCQANPQETLIPTHLGKSEFTRSAFVACFTSPCSQPARITLVSIATHTTFLDP